jgi:hypothetical protein
MKCADFNVINNVEVHLFCKKIYSLQNVKEI